MPSLLGPFFDVVERPSPWTENSEEIISYALDNIAKDVQSRVRSRLDVGIDYSSAMRASGIVTRHESGQLIIKHEASSGAEDTVVEDLFSTSMDPPTMSAGKLLFRTIHEKELQRKNQDVIQRSVEDAMGLKFVQHLEDGIRIVKAKHPELVR